MTVMMMLVAPRHGDTYVLLLVSMQKVMTMLRVVTLKREVSMLKVVSMLRWCRF